MYNMTRYLLIISVGSNTHFHEKAPVQEKKESKFWLDPEEFSLRKRLPPSLPRRNTDVYITNKTHFKAQVNRYLNYVQISRNGNNSVIWFFRKKVCLLTFFEKEAYWRILSIFRCERLIDEGITNVEDNANLTKGTESDRNALIYLHALGAAIPRALNLALQLQRSPKI